MTSEEIKIKCLELSLSINGGAANPASSLASQAANVAAKTVEDAQLFLDFIFPPSNQ